MTERTSGAVAAGHELTAEAAAQVLADGGNAFDAAVAGLWMACLAEPVLAAPGGGGFLMAREGTGGHTTLYDFFVQTPLRKRDPAELEFMSVHADFGTATQEFHIGHGASATPGFVPGLYAVHGDLGSLPMARLIEPAMAAARDGIVITRFQAFLAQVVAPILTATETGRAQFAPGGALRAQGSVVRNPGLARFYDGLTRDGLKFYLGAAAERFAAAQASSGQLGGNDFAAYRVVRRDPLAVGLSSARVLVNPPPSAGGAFIAHALHGLASASDGEAATVARALGASDRARLQHRGDVVRMLAEIGFTVDGEPDGGPASRGTTHI
ncbi:MAG: gamma-glutamyltransferase, partial [Hyphomicrobiales bacterium]